MNELIFFIYIITICIFNVVALKISKEALIALISLEAILANLFVTKEIYLFGLKATASDALIVGITLGLNLLQESFSIEITKKAIWISFYCAIVYMIFSQLHLAYIPTLEDINGPYFRIILSSMPRIIMASLFVYLIVQHIDSQLFYFFSNYFNKKFFIIRNYLSLTISQLLDTILFSFIGLYKLNEAFSSLNTIFQIIIISYIIKLIAIFISAPTIHFFKKIIRQ